MQSPETQEPGLVHPWRRSVSSGLSAVSRRARPLHNPRTTLQRKSGVLLTEEAAVLWLVQFTGEKRLKTFQC